MFKFFSAISDLIGVVIDFVVSAVEGIISLFRALGNGIAFVWSCVALLPPFLTVTVTVMVSACLVRFLLKKGAPDA